MKLEELEKRINPPLEKMVVPRRTCLRRCKDFLEVYWLPLLYLVVWVFCFVHLGQIIQQ